MKFSFLPVLFFAITMTSCSQKVNNNDETTIHARADSVVGVRMMETNQQAMEDLEKRMAIEVKAKADSIVVVARGMAVPQASPSVIKTDTAAPTRRGGLKRIFNDTASIR